MWKLELSGGLTEHYLCSVLLLGISSQELAVCLAASLVRHHQIYDIDVLFFESKGKVYENTASYAS
jgi:hypothetical protein